MFNFSIFSKYLCGESGIRTHDTLLRYTHFPGVRLRPTRPSLQNLSGILFSQTVFISGRKLMTFFYFSAINLD